MAPLEFVPSAPATGATVTQALGMTTPAAADGETTASSVAFKHVLQANTATEESVPEGAAKAVVAKTATEFKAPLDTISVEQGTTDAATEPQESLLGEVVLSDGPTANRDFGAVEKAIADADDQSTEPVMTAAIWMGLSLCLESRAVLQEPAPTVAETPAVLTTASATTDTIPLAGMGFCTPRLEALVDGNQQQVVSAQPIVGTWANPQTDEAHILGEASQPLLNTTVNAGALTGVKADVLSIVPTASMPSFTLSTLDRLSSLSRVDSSVSDSLGWAGIPEPATDVGSSSMPVADSQTMGTLSTGTSGAESSVVQIGSGSLAGPALGLADTRAAHRTVVTTFGTADVSVPATSRTEPLPVAYRELAVATAPKFAVEPHSPKHSTPQALSTSVANQTLTGTPVASSLKASGVTAAVNAGIVHDPVAMVPSRLTTDSNGIAVATATLPTLSHFPLRWSRPLTTMLPPEALPPTVELVSSSQHNLPDEMSSLADVTIGTVKNAPRAATFSLSLADLEQPVPVTLSSGQPSETVATATGEALLERSAVETGNSQRGPATQATPPLPSSSSLAASNSVSVTPTRLDATSPGTALTMTPETLHLNQKHWERTLGQQLNWMLNNQVQEAEIRVDPPHLGPLELRVSLHQNQTTVTFFSHEAVVREALEQALPRLRELLDAQGISLGQAQVSDQSLARQQAGWGGQPGNDQRHSPWPNTTPNTQADLEEAKPKLRPRRLLSSVDDYA